MSAPDWWMELETRGHYLGSSQKELDLVIERLVTRFSIPFEDLHKKTGFYNSLFVNLEQYNSLDEPTKTSLESFADGCLEFN